MRRLLWSVRKRLLRLSSAPREATRLGARWELDPRDNLDARLLIDQPFEQAQREAFATRLHARAPAALFDIGANFGLYAVTLARAFPALRVEAFEPVARTRAKLARNIALNGLEDRVRVHPLALSDRAGEAEIAMDPRSLGLSTLSASGPEAARRDFAGRESVKLARLDDLSGRRGEVLGFKIDVEGHEMATLAGMRRLLGANSGVMMAEIRPRNLEAARALLAELGWRETARIAEESIFEKD